MRYRPFGRSGRSASAVTLNLGEQTLALGRTAGPALVTEAMELGVNSFHLESPDPILGDLIGQAIAEVDRRLLFVSARVGSTRQRGQVTRDFSPAGVTAAIDHLLVASGLDFLDMVILDEPGEDELSHATLSALKALRASGRIEMLGIAGAGEVMDAYVTTNAFDVLVTPFNVHASWATRNRIRSAVDRDMAVIAYDYFPRELSSPNAIAAEQAEPRRGLFGWGGTRKDPDLKGLGAFAFLHQTYGWDAEDICLGYALAEPTLASAIINTADTGVLARLAEVPDRNMPPGMAAQIEMARVNMAAAKSA